MKFIKIVALILIVLPCTCFAQFTITGKVLNHADTRPIANASIFLSNATIGDKTDADGAFTLHNVKAGKYELVVSVIGFETYRDAVTVNNNNIRLSPISLLPKTITLNAVTIKATTDPNREKYLEWFKEEFLGKSALAKECKITNSEIIDLSYDDDKSILTASSTDFINIENPALGYKIKYLLTNFTKDNKDIYARKVHYEGSALFELMRGTSQQEKVWQQQRLQVYENSSMHFLRAALSNRIGEEGFRVLQLARYYNPKNPQKVTEKLLDIPLNKNEIVSQTNQLGVYALGCDGDGLNITYNKNLRFGKKGQLGHLDDANNNEVTLLKFNSPVALFDDNGVITNPNSLTFAGAWGNNRIAELLPLDYEPPTDEVIKSDTTHKNVAAKLENFLNTRKMEQAYLHFDKPYYAAGDTIYFKAYVTLGERHKLTTLSGILHVDLINTTGKIDKSIQLHLITGTAAGDFALPDSLPKGNYRIRAYTNWMRNEGDEAYFERTIPVGSNLQTNVSESGSKQLSINNYAPDIQFLPEGGNLVIGVQSKVAFKAIEAHGLGINVKGVLVDNDDKQITEIKASNLGMGYFYITPQAGKTYTAKLNFANGTHESILLPIANKSGITLKINNDSLTKASVRIEANDEYYRQNKNNQYTLVIYSAGTVVKLSCLLDTTVISLDIIKRRLHTGIATITLFAPNGEPLSERLFYIENYDKLSFDVNNKSNYRTRKKVNINLNIKNRAGDGATGNFSVAVTDESKVPVDENAEPTILNYLLLTAELKGYVEQPNYYFINPYAKISADLDLVMLTHGYRRFEWQPVLQNNYPPITYEAEASLSISGLAKSVFGNPLKKGNVALIAQQGGPVLSEVTDDKGHFSFNNLEFTDTTKFILQAVNAKGKNNTQLSYEAGKPPLVKTLPVYAAADTLNQLIGTYMDNHIKQFADYAKYGSPKGLLLKEVKIKDTKPKDDYPSSALMGPGHADQVMHYEDIEKLGSGLLSDLLAGRLHRVKFDVKGNPGSTFGQMSIIMDGIDVKNLNDINSHDIETIETFFGASAAIYGVRAGNGVLIITTRHGQGLQAKDINSVGILPIKAKGYYKAREFYSPRYDNSAQPYIHNDLRSTIYWNPNVLTDKNGNASFSFFNADGKGTYRVVVEGIDDNGNLGRQVFKYKVE